MFYDVEPLVLSGRLEVRSDCIEFSVRSPGRPGRQSFAPLPQLELTEIIGSVYEVQLVRNACALKKLPKPLALGSSVTRKVENDSDTPRQEIQNMGRQGISHSARVLDEALNIPNLPGIQSIKELILNEENGVLSPCQLTRMSGFSSGHLPAHEVQFRAVNIHAIGSRIIFHPAIRRAAPQSAVSPKIALSAGRFAATALPNAETSLRPRIHVHRN
jgi:hypothetical protein